MIHPIFHIDKKYEVDNFMNSRLLTTLFLFYGTSFGMIIPYKETKEILKTYALSKEEQDFCALEAIYKNQNDPQFVVDFLKNHKPAVVLLSLPRDNNNRYCALNPYDTLFYKEPDKQFLDKDPEIIERGNRYLKRALIQKRLKEKVNIEDYATADPLVNTFIFGDRKEVSKLLKEIDNEDSDGNNSLWYLLLDDMIVACGDCPRPKNDTIELLLSKIQQKVNAGQWDIENVPVVLNSRDLLYSTAQNKELFSLYDYLTTNLEWMMKEKNHFDQEHIDIFLRDGSGMTVAEVQYMEQVERILNNHLTDQEAHERIFWEKVITEVNGINNNKYLESLRVQNGL